MRGRQGPGGDGTRSEAIERLPRRRNRGNIYFLQKSDSILDYIREIFFIFLYTKP